MSKQSLHQKRPFLLVEVIVAIALLAIAGFSFFEVEKLLAKEAKKNYYQVEAERMYHIALSKLIVELEGKKIGLDTLKREEPFEVDIAQPKWKAICQIDEMRGLEENNPLNYYLKVRISLEHSEFGEFPLVSKCCKPFTFFLTKEIEKKPDSDDPDGGDEDDEDQEDSDQEIEDEESEESEEEDDANVEA